MAELSHRVAFLAWLDCADGATRRQIAAELADHDKSRVDHDRARVDHDKTRVNAP